MLSAKGTPAILAFTSFLVTLLLFVCIKPIAQDPEYHQFADHKMLLGIPCCWNVISNLGFVLVGVYGFRVLTKYTIHSLFSYMLFVGIILTGLGSAYYHYHPSNSTLVWDRIPMTIVFTSFFAQLYAWYFSGRTAMFIWIISIVTGIFSVFYWQYTEYIHRGDLRLYALIQYLPMMLIAIILTRHYHQNNFLFKPLLYILLLYIVAKLFEHFDQNIYHAGNFISGHSLKHVAAATATYFMVVIVRKHALKNNAE